MRLLFVIGNEMTRNILINKLIMLCSVLYGC